MREIYLFRKASTHTLHIYLDVLQQTAVDMATHLHIRSPKVLVMAGVTENRQTFFMIHYIGPNWTFRAEGADIDTLLKDYVHKLSTNVFKSQYNGQG